MSRTSISLLFGSLWPRVTGTCDAHRDKPSQLVRFLILFPVALHFIEVRLHPPTRRKTATVNWRAARAQCAHSRCAGVGAGVAVLAPPLPRLPPHLLVHTLRF